MVNYGRATDSLQQSSRKMETGKEVGTVSDDSVGRFVSMKLDIDQIITNSQKVNLQNFITLLQSQDEFPARASSIYDRMSVLDQRATGPFSSEADNGASSDKELLNDEFKEPSERISLLIDMQLNEHRLLGWVKMDFTQGLHGRNDFPPANLPQITTKDVQSISKENTLELCLGRTGDQVWVFHGKLPSELNSYLKPPIGEWHANTSELSDELYEYFNGSKDPSYQVIFTTDRRQTVGTSQNGIFDNLTINFNGCEVNLDAEFHSLNQTSAGTLSYNPFDGDIKSANYNQLYGVDLRRMLECDSEFLLSTPSGNSTKIAMIGVNTGYTATCEMTALYEPGLPYNDIDVPGTNGVFPAIPYGELECLSISTAEDSFSVLSKIDAPVENLLNSRANIAVTQNRYNQELGKINLNEMPLEQAHSRVADADYEAEAPGLAKQLIRAISYKVSTEIHEVNGRIDPANHEPPSEPCA